MPVQASCGRLSQVTGCRLQAGGRLPTGCLLQARKRSCCCSSSSRKQQAAGLAAKLQVAITSRKPAAQHTSCPPSCQPQPHVADRKHGLQVQFLGLGQT